MQSGFQASTLWLNGLLVNSSLHGCYSNLSSGTISWHLNGLYFPDIQRGGQWHCLMRRLGDIKWLSFQMYHIGPTFGHFEHGLLSVLEGRGARWRWGRREIEGADRPGRAERKAGRAAETWWAMRAFCSPPSVCCGLARKAKGTSPVLCSRSQGEAARQPGLLQTPEPPIMQGHNSLANKVAEHLALWILSKSLQIHYENGSNWTDIWIPEAQGHSFVC